MDEVYQLHSRKKEVPPWQEIISFVHDDSVWLFLSSRSVEKGNFLWHFC